ncbi:MAG: hypothetical protein HY898_35520 [Deltaproteobacteria bacterium]|nr:hypothetical protein [Deltaproteobacteria bacterium]
MTTNQASQNNEQRALLAPGILGRLSEIGQVLVPGIFAWAVTVVPCATMRGASRIGWVVAFLGFAALVAGAFLMRDRPRLGRALGIWVFLLFSLITWILNPAGIRPDRIDPVRAASGTFGWVLYGLGWGAPWRPGVHPEDNPRAQLHPKLEPRRIPVLRMPLVVAIAAVGAICALALAWRALDVNRALMMHGTALAVAVGLVTAAARIGLLQGQKRNASAPRQRIMHAFPWLMAIATLLIMVVAWWLSR